MQTAKSTNLLWLQGLIDGANRSSVCGHGCIRVRASLGRYRMKMLYSSALGLKLCSFGLTRRQ